MRILLAIVFLSLTGAFAGGGQSLSKPELEEAKRIYVAKCSRCHKFYEPSAYSDSEWRQWMEKMRKKSKLKPPQYDLVWEYTESLRSKTAENGR